MTTPRLPQAEVDAARLALIDRQVAKHAPEDAREKLSAAIRAVLKMPGREAVNLNRQIDLF